MSDLKMELPRPGLPILSGNGSRSPRSNGQDWRKKNLTGRKALLTLFLRRLCERGFVKNEEVALLLR